jgi:hypothetical protein
MSYTEHHTLPEFVMAEQDEDGATTNLGGAPVWSGQGAPPAIGEVVNIEINERGFGTVRNYFVQSGWLGIVVDLADPPAEYVERQGGNVPCHVFGAELAAPALAPDGDAFSPSHLDQLRAFYGAIPAIDPAMPTYGRLIATLDAMTDANLRQIADADVKFLSALARNRCIRRGC